MLRCKWCLHFFSSYESLIDHNTECKINHGIWFARKEDNNGSRRMNCYICGSICLDIYSLKKHVRLYHPDGYEKSYDRNPCEERIPAQTARERDLLNPRGRSVIRGFANISLNLNKNSWQAENLKYINKRSNSLELDFNLNQDDSDDKDLNIVQRNFNDRVSRIFSSDQIDFQDSDENEFHLNQIGFERSRQHPPQGKRDVYDMWCHGAKSFRQSDDHFRQKCTDESLTKIICKWCGTKILGKYNLKRHLQKVHPYPRNRISAGKNIHDCSNKGKFKEKIASKRFEKENLSSIHSSQDPLKSTMSKETNSIEASGFVGNVSSGHLNIHDLTSEDVLNDDKEKIIHRDSPDFEAQSSEEQTNKEGKSSQSVEKHSSEYDSPCSDGRNDALKQDFISGRSKELTSNSKVVLKNTSQCHSTKDKDKLAECSKTIRHTRNAADSSTQDTHEQTKEKFNLQSELNFDHSETHSNQKKSLATKDLHSIEIKKSHSITDATSENSVLLLNSRLRRSSSCIMQSASTSNTLLLQQNISDSAHSELKESIKSKTNEHDESSDRLSVLKNFENLSQTKSDPIDSLKNHSEHCNSMAKHGGKCDSYGEMLSETKSKTHSMNDCKNDINKESISQSTKLTTVNKEKCFLPNFNNTQSSLEDSDSEKWLVLSEVSSPIKDSGPENVGDKQVKSLDQSETLIQAVCLDTARSFLQTPSPNKSFKDAEETVTSLDRKKEKAAIIDTASIIRKLKHTLQSGVIDFNNPLLNTPLHGKTMMHTITKCAISHDGDNCFQQPKVSEQNASEKVLAGASDKSLFGRIVKITKCVKSSERSLMPVGTLARDNLQESSQRKDDRTDTVTSMRPVEEEADSVHFLKSSQSHSKVETKNTVINGRSPMAIEIGANEMDSSMHFHTKNEMTVFHSIPYCGDDKEESVKQNVSGARRDTSLCKKQEFVSENTASDRKESLVSKKQKHVNKNAVTLLGVSVLSNIQKLDKTADSSSGMSALSKKQMLRAKSAITDVEKLSANNKQKLSDKNAVIDLEKRLLKLSETNGASVREKSAVLMSLKRKLFETSSRQELAIPSPEKQNISEACAKGKLEIPPKKSKLSKASAKRKLTLSLSTKTKLSKVNAQEELAGHLSKKSKLSEASSKERAVYLSKKHQNISDKHCVNECKELSLSKKSKPHAKNAFISDDQKVSNLVRPKAPAHVSIAQSENKSANVKRGNNNTQNIHKSVVDQSLFDGMRVSYCNRKVSKIKLSDLKKENGKETISSHYRRPSETDQEVGKERVSSHARRLSNNDKKLGNETAPHCARGPKTVKEIGKETFSHSVNHKSKSGFYLIEGDPENKADSSIRKSKTRDKKSQKKNNSVLSKLQGFSSETVDSECQYEQCSKSISTKWNLFQDCFYSHSLPVAELQHPEDKIKTLEERTKNISDKDVSMTLPKTPLHRKLDNITVPSSGRIRANPAAPSPRKQDNIAVPSSDMTAGNSPKSKRKIDSVDQDFSDKSHFRVSEEIGTTAIKNSLVNDLQSSLLHKKKRQGQRCSHSVEDKLLSELGKGKETFNFSMGRRSLVSHNSESTRIEGYLDKVDSNKPVNCEFLNSATDFSLNQTCLMSSKTNKQSETRPKKQKSGKSVITVDSSTSKIKKPYDQCSKNLVTEEKLSLHKHTSKQNNTCPFTINNCPKSDQNKQLKHNDFDIFFKSSEFKCKLCDLPFISERNLKRHQVKLHSESSEKSVICSDQQDTGLQICAKTTHNSFEYLKTSKPVKHIKALKKSALLSCRICRKTFYKDSKFIQHLPCCGRKGNLTKYNFEKFSRKCTSRGKKSCKISKDETKSAHNTVDCKIGPNCSETILISSRSISDVDSSSMQSNKDLPSLKEQKSSHDTELQCPLPLHSSVTEINKSPCCANAIEERRDNKHKLAYKKKSNSKKCSSYSKKMEPESFEITEPGSSILILDHLKENKSPDEYLPDKQPCTIPESLKNRKKKLTVFELDIPIEELSCSTQDVNDHSWLMHMPTLPELPSDSSESSDLEDGLCPCVPKKEVKVIDNSRDLVVESITTTNCNKENSGILAAESSNCNKESKIMTVPDTKVSLGMVLATAGELRISPSWTCHSATDNCSISSLKKSEENKFSLNVENCTSNAQHLFLRPVIKNNLNVPQASSLLLTDNINEALCQPVSCTTDVNDSPCSRKKQNSRSRSNVKSASLNSDSKSYKSDSSDCNTLCKSNISVSDIVLESKVSATQHSCENCIGSPTHSLKTELISRESGNSNKPPEIPINPCCKLSNGESNNHFRVNVDPTELKLSSNLQKMTVNGVSKGNASPISAAHATDQTPVSSPSSSPSMKVSNSEWICPINEVSRSSGSKRNRAKIREEHRSQEHKSCQRGQSYDIKENKILSQKVIPKTAELSEKIVSVDSMCDSNSPPLSEFGFTRNVKKKAKLDLLSASNVTTTAEVQDDLNSSVQIFPGVDLMDLQYEHTSSILSTENFKLSLDVQPSQKNKIHQPSQKNKIHHSIDVISDGLKDRDSVDVISEPSDKQRNNKCTGVLNQSSFPGHISDSLCSLQQKLFHSSLISANKYSHSSQQHIMQASLASTPPRSFNYCDVHLSCTSQTKLGKVNSMLHPTHSGVYAVQTSDISEAECCSPLQKGNTLLESTFPQQEHKDGYYSKIPMPGLNVVEPSSYRESLASKNLTHVGVRKVLHPLFQQRQPSVEPYHMVQVSDISDEESLLSAPSATFKENDGECCTLHPKIMQYSNSPTQENKHLLCQYAVLQNHLPYQKCLQPGCCMVCQQCEKQYQSYHFGPAFTCHCVGHHALDSIVSHSHSLLCRKVNNNQRLQENTYTTTSKSQGSQTASTDLCGKSSLCIHKQFQADVIYPCEVSSPQDSSSNNLPYHSKLVSSPSDFLEQHQNRRSENKDKIQAGTDSNTSQLDHESNSSSDKVSSLSNSVNPPSKHCSVQTAGANWNNLTPVMTLFPVSVAKIESDLMQIVPEYDQMTLDTGYVADEDDSSSEREIFDSTISLTCSHLWDMSSSEDNSACDSDVDTTYICAQCNKIFADNHVFKRHLQDHMNKMQTPSKKRKKRFKSHKR